MNDYQKSCLGAVVVIGLFFVVGLVVVIYSLLVSNGVLPPPGREAAAATITGAVSPSGSKNVTVAPAAQSPDEGQAIFNEKCIICHTIGGGTLVGPDLKGVTTRRDRDWLARWILEPDQVLAEGDPLATELLAEFNNVPMLNQALTEAQVAAVLAYLEAQTGETTSVQPAEASAPALPEGDSVRGLALFTGGAGFQNGAPSCMGCHSTAGAGTLGGGTLGPDLTNVHNRYGEAGLAAALKSLPFPTMEGVFAGKPLTDDEVAHLYAYFVQTDQAVAQPVNFNFVWIGLGGFIILVLLSHLIWNKRLTGVRIPLVGR